ncbi:uncharacterized protein [Pseudorasbora parva]|uniref:uncharacterized protein n=1 Tax=Pseudorasbora parva TaxID=51549 RepID=UPI00351F2204
MSLIHPVYVSPMNTYPFLIGKDLLDRFEPVLDFKQLKVWAQVRDPLPLQTHTSSEQDCQVTEVTGTPAEPDCQVTKATGPPAAHCDNTASAPKPSSSSLLCTFQLSKDSDAFCPQVMNDLQLNDIITTNSIPALWADNSTKSLSLCNAISKNTPHGDMWAPPNPTSSPIVAVLTHSKRSTPATMPALQLLSLTPQISNNDIADMQDSDTAIKTILDHLSDPSNHPITDSELIDDSSHKHLHNSRHMMRILDNILWFAPDGNTAPRLVVPRSQRGVMLMYAHNTPCAGHHGTRATYDTLKQVAYGPGTHQDAAEYVREWLVRCQFQPANPNHRAPLQHRGITFPWPNLQIDRVEPLPRSTKGKKYFLTVVCQFTKWVECLPAPNDTAQTTAYPLRNHIFFLSRLPLRINSDRGIHFTTEAMQQIWKCLRNTAVIMLLCLQIIRGQPPPDIITPGPASGIVLREQPGLLITNCK